MGEDRVIVGSDWPHMEGLERPLDILDEIEDLTLTTQQKILHDNTVELNKRIGI
jgi:predicted TIM-barrel fold metal-dependent hydrolase